ncbi:hypothetical protein LIER_15615 [Lithospermum erythrorhizon]|uniref:Uncharacterized protein n=1 Tax=Lithospermum erythrorhizon TaxID=34254 RepID=A0AAV3Q4K8_LITER
MSKFKESLLKRQPQDLEEVNERAYKYIRIEGAEKSAEKGHGKRPVEDNRCRSPRPRGEVPWIRFGHSRERAPSFRIYPSPGRTSRG